jgi:uncharacterized protein (DUF305 family)
MLRFTLSIAAALLAALAPAACAPVAVAPAQQGAAPAATESAEATATEAAATPGMEGMDHGAAAHGAEPFDAQFIDSMSEHHRGAVMMAEQALEQAEHGELRALATEIVAAQEAELTQMEEWRATWYPDLPPTHGMGMEMGEMALAEDESVPFDRRFLEAMISHHQGAITMAEHALEAAEHEEIRQMAEGIITAQAREIAQMQEWLSAWYGGEG